MRFMRPKRASSANMMRSRRSRRAAARRAFLTASGSGFFKSNLCREVALGMKRSWRQLTPVVSVQQVVHRAVAGGMSDRFLVVGLEIMDVQHLAGASGSGKRASKAFSSGTVMFWCLRLPFGSGLARRGHRGQRPCARGSPCSATPPSPPHRWLRHTTFTQQHHLNALALRCRNFPPQRSFSRRISALLHLTICSPRIRWLQRITSQE